MTHKRTIDPDLESLRDTLMGMGGVCEEMIHLAVKLLLDHDAALMDGIREREEKVNRLHIEVDERCLRLLALHQPAAIDLRLVAAAIKVNSDLERVGDQAVNIAETSLHLCRLPPMRLGDIPRMAELAAGMLKDALDSFARGDVELARSVIDRDDEEDRLKSSTFSELLALMQSDASTIQRALEHILISRNLERIADHATNIAEDAIFMVLGKDIRHGAEREAGPQGLPEDVQA
ncbi:MAG: phosphate signaling complex protein PhoU [Elusimicrobia bacterium]|nr:phosphate signaling complex protein PhoU [Elusimicrobiota bacterium]